MAMWGNCSPSTKKHYSVLPKSRLPSVILHDNNSQQNLLKIKLSNIAEEEARARQRLDLRRRTFLTRQAIKQHDLTSSGIHRPQLIPQHLAMAHIKLAHFPSRRHQRMQDDVILMTSPQRAGKSIRYDGGEGKMTAFPSGSVNMTSRSAPIGRLPCKRDLTFMSIPTKRKTEQYHMFPDILSTENVNISGDQSQGQDQLDGRTDTMPPPSGHSKNPHFSDHRFTNLRETLISPASNDYVDGFLNLSEAGRSVVRDHMASLVAWQQSKRKTIENLVGEKTGNQAENTSPFKGQFYSGSSGLSTTDLSGVSSDNDSTISEDNDF